jgi:hypothetical protein
MTRSTISGRSDGMSPGGRAAAISGHATLEVNVINRPGQPNFLQFLCSLGIFGTNSEARQ